MSVSATRRVVIVGAGQAGSEAATRLRSSGFQGDITLVGDESFAPYQRPPLSKKYLSGELSDYRLLLRSADAYAVDGIDLRLDTKVVTINRRSRTVQFGNGGEAPYDVLILATGALARSLNLPGVALPGVHYLRTARDVQLLRSRLRAGAKLSIVGAGYIGLEVAAVARSLSLDVTVIEAAHRPLSRVTSPEIAAFFQSEHEAHKVRFALNAQVVAIKGETAVRSVMLADGRELPTDIVLIGAGIQPNTTLADDAGLAVAKDAPPRDGIITDASTRTSDPLIYAIGDCARRPLPHLDNQPYRLESVHNAVEGAKIATADIMGMAALAPTLEPPWFWSDQYDLKLTIVGLLRPYDTSVLRGSTAEKSFAYFYYSGDRLLAVDAVNRQADYLAAKLAMQRGVRLSPDAVRDSSRPMKDILATAPPNS